MPCVEKLRTSEGMPGTGSTSASIPRRLLSISTTSHFTPLEPPITDHKITFSSSSSCFSASSLPEQHLRRIRLLSLLRDCSAARDLQRGRQAHAQAIVTGVCGAGAVQHRITEMYAHCGSLRDASNAFLTSHRRELPALWNSMMGGLASAGRPDLALLLYLKMLDRGVSPDRYTFPLVIKACSALRAIDMGRDVHRAVRGLGLEADVFIASSLIGMYVVGGSVRDAREVFDGMPVRDSVLWNVMIGGYSGSNCVEEAVELFRFMRRSSPELSDDVSFVSALSACAASQGMLSCGVQIHGLAVRCGVDNGPAVANTLLALYSKSCRWSDMHKLCDAADVVAWNGMISGYVQNGLPDEALDSFHEMQSLGVKPDSVTLTCLLPVFADLHCSMVARGKEIHGYIARSCMDVDVFLKSALIDVYFKCRKVEMARGVFYGSSAMDIVVCSAMISGYVLNGMDLDALDMFRLILRWRLRPNPVTVASLLPACSSLFALRLGKELHGYALKNGFTGRCHVESAVLDMYAKCGRVDLACQIFARMPERDSVAWNSMISSFVQNAEPGEAIYLFRQMGLDGVLRDCASISSALSACASIPALHYGMEIHGFMVRNLLNSDIFAECALMDMYSKSGQLLSARRVFDSIPRKNEVSWNNIIAAYGIHGNVNEAVILFDAMKESGCRPDHVTFLSMFSACGHAGRVKEGIQYFKSMHEDYGISPRMDHYASMVDVYGRAGWLDDALRFINEMPVKPDISIWGALLGACRVHRNAEIGELATRFLFEQDPQNSGYYVLMSHVQAASGKWKGVLKVRSLMKERGVQKPPGCSWVNIISSNHMFIASDKSHPQTTDIYLLLDLLLFEMKEEGYVPLPEYACPLPQYST